VRRSGPTEEEAQRTQEDRGDGQLSLAHRALANLGRSVGGGEGKFGARLLIVRTRMRRRISSTAVDTLGAQPTRWTCTSGDLEDRQAQDCFDFRH
jgi:hypothetical protein